MNKISDKVIGWIEEYLPEHAIGEDLDRWSYDVTISPAMNPDGSAQTIGAQIFLSFPSPVLGESISMIVMIQDVLAVDKTAVENVLSRAVQGLTEARRGVLAESNGHSGLQLP